MITNNRISSTFIHLDRVYDPTNELIDALVIDSIDLYSFKPANETGLNEPTN